MFHDLDGVFHDLHDVVNVLHDVVHVLVGSRVLATPPETFFERRGNAETMASLVAVATVDDAAAICDYLQDRVDADDGVIAVTVHPPDASTPDSDRSEALNVVRVRLGEPSVEAVERRGDVAAELRAALTEHDVDEVVAGRSGSESDDWAPGPAAAALADAASVPVVLVPLSEA